MKVLLINGSPKGTNSNTLCLTEAFLECFYPLPARLPGCS